ncbi:MAG: LysM peptidoglycan-binding domain-containing protein [Acidimicrobiales bacterium]
MRAHRTTSTTAAVVALAFLALLGTGTHTVARGETLSGIASRYGTTTAEMAAVNRLAVPDHIEAGMRLVVPGADAPATPQMRAYTVRRGDTLGGIARAQRVSLTSLLAVNALKNPNVIRIGQVLRVPTAQPPAPGGTTSTVRTPAGGATSHIVGRGDTISGIARRYGISQVQLIKANGLTDERIYLGQRLRLLPVAPAPPTGAQVTHTVRAGETLSDIARRHGVTIRSLREANKLVDPNLIVVDQVLTVPTGPGLTQTIVCPVRGPMRHVNDWGFPRSGGRFHEGNDLLAAKGTPVVATTRGQALQTVGRIGGRQVKLIGSDGVIYYYTHLDSFAASGLVAAGTVIGAVGNSGNATGGPPHVHFEMHPNGGAAVNPYPRLAAVC